jgi:hypothetical protein
MCVCGQCSRMRRRRWPELVVARRGFTSVLMFRNPCRSKHRPTRLAGKARHKMLRTSATVSTRLTIPQIQDTARTQQIRGLTAETPSANPLRSPLTSISPDAGNKKTSAAEMRVRRRGAACEHARVLGAASASGLQRGLAQAITGPTTMK